MPQADGIVGPEKRRPDSSRSRSSTGSDAVDEKAGDDRGHETRCETSVKPNRELSPAITTSQTHARPDPPANALPRTAAMTGLG